MSDRRTSFYLDKRNAKFLGVCAGIADYFDIDVLWVRLGFAASVLVFQLWVFMLPLYFMTAWLANPKPNALYLETPDEREFWTKVRVAPQRSIRDVRSSLRGTERRLRDVEAYVTSSNSRLANEIDGLR